MRATTPYGTLRKKANLDKGRKKMSRHWPVWPYRINYNTYSEVLKLPVFNLTKFQSGFHCEELNARENPFGTLAERTVGDMYALKDGGRLPRCGLELSFDKLLRGTNGVGHRRKVLNKYLDIIDKEPVNGCDIITTIDVGIQDLAERARSSIRRSRTTPSATSWSRDRSSSPSVS